MTTPRTTLTDMRAFRCPRYLWFAALDKARQDGTDLSAVLRTKLTEYVGNDNDHTAAQPPLS